PPACQSLPADSQALRVTLFDCSPAWVTQPPITCSTSDGSMPALSHSAYCTRASSAAGCSPESSPRPILPRAIGVRTASTITASRIASPPRWDGGNARSVELPEDHGAGGNADPGGHQHVVVAGRLVRRVAADQPHALVDAVHAVDVGLGELPAVGVARQPAAHLEVAVLHEVPGLAAPAEPERLELPQDHRR